MFALFPKTLEPAMNFNITKWALLTEENDVNYSITYVISNTKNVTFALVMLIHFYKGQNN